MVDLEKILSAECLSELREKLGGVRLYVPKSGRYRSAVTAEIIVSAVSHGGTIDAIAYDLSVSRRTILRRLKQSGISIHAAKVRAGESDRG